MKRFGAAAMAAVTLSISACATQPDQIHAEYVSPTMYQSWNCDQIRDELARVTSRVQEVTGQQKRKATNDAVAMTVGLVIFWPALFVLALGQDQKDELARLKGEYDALNQVQVANRCTYAPPPQAVVGAPQPATVAAPVPAPATGAVTAAK